MNIFTKLMTENLKKTTQDQIYRQNTDSSRWISLY